MPKYRRKQAMKGDGSILETLYKIAVELALLVGVSQVYISQFETGGLVPSESQIKKITEILGISQETLNKALHQFYEARKRELKKRIEGEQGNARIPV